MPLDHLLKMQFLETINRAEAVKIVFCDTQWENDMLSHKINSFRILLNTMESISGAHLERIKPRLCERETELSRICAEISSIPRSPRHRTRYAPMLPLQGLASKAILRGGPNGPFWIETFPVDEASGETPALDSRVNLLSPSGNFNFVVMVSDPLNIRIGQRGHSALSKGARVFYAGIIVLQNGQLESWDNNSGHFQPAPNGPEVLFDMLPADKFKANTAGFPVVPRFTSL